MSDDIQNDNQIDELVGKLVEAIQKYTPPEIRVYTIEETAQILKCKPNTVRNLIYRSLELSPCKIGRELRVTHQSLVKFLENRTESCIYDYE